MRCEEVVKRLRALGNPDAVAGMARFGINTKRAYGVSIPDLRKLAKEIGKDHKLAQELWKIDNRETRILAGMVDEPELVTESQMENWVKDFADWEVCDQVCQNLFIYTGFAYQKAQEWSRRDEEFVKRAGFALMAWLAFKDKEAKDAAFERFLPAIKRAATDNRNFVKKAVNWALRQIGKRNVYLNERALETARAIAGLDSKGAQWIARDAIKELTSRAVQRRLKRQVGG